ncbi:MAG: 50S ribosomal protein L3 N(5)-glutamine methyltransferase [Acidiferrobacterales bacterium]
MNVKADSEPATLRNFIIWGERQLRDANVVFGHGTDNALDESAWLIGASIGIVPADIDAQLYRMLTEPEQMAARKIVEERITTRKPAAYLLHEAWFAGLRFYVDPRVIVPRSLIGEFVLEEFQPWIKKARLRSALDLCTGSGCIAVAIARTFPESRVDAVDISPEALDVARINIATYGLEQRVRLMQSDLFSAIAGERYDLIVSNPPYVGGDELAGLPAEYRHEPELALASGVEGLDAVTRILSQAPDHLSTDGVLIVEVGNSRDALEARFPKTPFTWLATSSGDESVFLLDKGELTRQRRMFESKI